MDRLLSEQEITLIVGWPSAFEYAKIVELNKAQLAKTDKEWVEYLDKLFHNLLPYICLERKYLQCETCPEMRKEVCAYNVWQGRKRELEKRNV